MRALITICLFIFPVDALGWQLAVGGGLTAGMVPAIAPTGTASGWSILAQWTRQPRVGQRWTVDVGLGQFGTGHVHSGLLERGRIESAALLWERRVPLHYGLRPWLGIGAGLDHVRYDDRLRTDAQGYAIGTLPAAHDTAACLQVAIAIPISRSWSTSLVGSTDFPGHLSTITLTLLWRLL